MSTVDVDPSTLFGGTWERIKDTFLLAAGDSYSAGSTGGATTHTHTNPSTGSTAITTDQMPSHNHSFSGTSSQWGYSRQTGRVLMPGTYQTYASYVTPTYIQGCESADGSASWVWGVQAWSDAHAHTYSGYTSAAGSGQGHTHTMGNTGSSSNMPPYLTVYCWRRTA